MSRTKKIIGIFAISVLIIAELLCFVGCINKIYGEFYTLEEAYEQGFISRDDLQNIAYYNNREKPIEEFTPKPLEPEELSESTAKKIQKDALYGKENVEIKWMKYYGTYNGCIAVAIHTTPYENFSGEVVDEVLFSSYIKIKIWKEKGE